MKKLMSVFVLLMFVGSLIIMTGCFGGDDGIGAILGTVFVIAIVASSGGSGAAVFAANNRESLRPTINLASDTYLMVTPLDEKGVAVGTPEKITTGITFNSTDNTFSYNHTVNTNAYSQYRVDFYNSNVKILEGIKYVAPAQMTGVATLTVNATSTAEVKMFETWPGTSTRKRFSDFSYNRPVADRDLVATQVFNKFNHLGNPTFKQGNSPDYTTVLTDAGVNPAVYATTEVYSISGYVTQVDGAGSSNAYVMVSSTNPQFSTSAHCVNGYFTVTGVPAGTYTVSASIPDHTFEPCCYENVVVTDADITGKNFQAKTRTTVQAPIGG